MLSTNACSDSAEWKTSAMLDTYNKNFQNTFIRVDQLEVPTDFDKLFKRLDSDDDNTDDEGDEYFDDVDDDEMYYEGTTRSFNIISTQDIYKGVC